MMTSENAAAKTFTVEKTIHHVLGTCSWIIDRVIQLEIQVKEIRTISNNWYEEISTALPKPCEDLSSQVKQI